MNKNNLLKILLLVCAAVLIVSVALGLRQVAGWAGYQYDSAQEYTAGDAEITKPVRNLDIDWLNGAVHIAYHSGDSVLLCESSNKAIGADLRMRWRLDGDTLRVRYAKAGLHSYGSQEKELTVTLPKGLVLKEADIGATSGSLDIPALAADSLHLELTSGDVFAAVEARTIDAGATSGSIRLEAPKAKRVRLDSTSGAIYAALDSVGELEVTTTSGDIRVEIGALEDGKIDSTSGSIRAEIGALGSLKIDSTSGDVELLLPEKPGFTAHIDSISGRFSHSLPLTQQGKDCLCGDGSGKLDVSTTSGNISLSPLA